MKPKFRGFSPENDDTGPSQHNLTLKNTKKASKTHFFRFFLNFFHFFHFFFTFLTFFYFFPVFTRHQYFIDFESHDFPAPVYMNLIRDPVDRFASFYYFSRYGNARSGLKKAPPNHMTLDVWNESLDECVSNHRRECISPIWHTVPYLCGNSGACQEKTEHAIQETKRNIERNYFVIGVLEDFKSFLKMVEQLLPKYFDGALEIYEKDSIRNDTYTLNKKGYSEQTRTWLQTMTPLQLEYEIYHFVRARFRVQAQKLGLN